MVSFTQLMHFIAVAKAGTFTGAARSLEIAQPAISQSIAALERELDAQLLVRTSRTCTLTAVGAEFLSDADRVVKDLEAAVLRARRLASVGTQKIVIGMTGGLSNLLTERLLHFGPQGHSGLDIVVVEGSVGRLRQLLLEGRIDCALSYPGPTDDSKIKNRFVAYEPMHLVAHPEVMGQYPMEGRFDLHQLAKFPLFLPSVLTEAGAGQLLNREAVARGVKLDVRFELQSTMVIRRLLLQDRLATVIALGSVIDDVASGLLASHLIEAPEFVREVTLSMLASRPYGPAENTLLALIKKIAGDFLIPCGVWRREATDFAEPDLASFRAMRSDAALASRT